VLNIVVSHTAENIGALVAIKLKDWLSSTPIAGVTDGGSDVKASVAITARITREVH